jgi:predicted DNA-binding protein (MmcQ/YjbR family)
MTLDQIRAYCKTLPHVTEDVKWGHDLCFLIGGKMFCVLNLEPQRGDRSMVALKATEEEFAELVEREDIIPAPYMARNKWVSLTTYDALPPAEMKQRIARSYELVLAKLPKKAQAALRVAPTNRKERK